MAQKVDAYVKSKRGLGCKFKGAEMSLKKFARFADYHYPGKPLTIQLAVEWVATTPHLKSTTKLGRYSDLRGLAQYLKLDDSKTELIPKNIYTSWFRRMTPYIYTDREISLLMNTDPEKPQGEFDTLTRKTIFGLLVSTGMRIQEVLDLKKKDVNLKKGIIAVRQFKKVPLRLLPVSDSVLEKLEEYARRRDGLQVRGKDDTFFLNSKGKFVKYVSFQQTWKRVTVAAGLSDGKVFPRLHDLRHTFACNHLLRAYRENQNIDDAIYTLSIYLGHTVIGGTYWYLSATAELLEECIKRVEKSLCKFRKGGRS